MAHQGTAERSLDLLKHEETMAAVAQGLEDNPGHRLIFSGHSLGAAMAVLMGIKLNFEAHPLVRRGLQCFGFGCPPVFGLQANSPTIHRRLGFRRVEDVIVNTVCFINGEDTVPFLSMDSIRQLADILEKVDKITEKLNPLDRLLMAQGIKEPPEDLVSIVKDGPTELVPLPGAARLEIPARFVVWMDDAANDQETTSADVLLCEPSKVSNLSIHLADEFIIDHFRYEERFEDLFKGTSATRFEKLPVALDVLNSSFSDTQPPLQHSVLVSS